MIAGCVDLYLTEPSPPPKTKGENNHAQLEQQNLTFVLKHRHLLQGKN